MPLTSPGNDDDTGENHQPTLRKNTAEPVEQTLKQNKQGHAIDEASVTTMARRIAAGEKPYEQSVPDLTGYDVFMKPRQPWERKEA